jgi:flagellin-like hook-associated protein FlgL
MTSIGPYSASGVGKPSLTRALAESRSQLDQLLAQLSTGKVSNDYAGLDGRSTSLAMRARLSAVESYQATAATVNVRLGLMGSALERLENIGAEYKLTDPNEYMLTSGSVTIAQSQAAVDLQEAIGQLNLEVNGRHLFSGRATDTKPVLSADAMLADDGDKAGLRTVIAERKLADLGASGRGRLNVSAVAGSTFTVAQQASGPFGFKISSLTSTLTGGVASGPAGAASAITLGVTGVPAAGEQVRVGLTLPDGSTEEIVLTVKSPDDVSAVAPGEFRIGATPAETAANMRASFDAALKTEANTSLVAASAMQAGNEFFDTPAGAEPARVAGFDAANPTDAARVAALQGATSLDTTGTAARTVTWYAGDDSADDPRRTAGAKIDDGVSVAYGARASEDGPRRVVQTLAVFSSMTFATDDPDGQARYSALANRTIATLGSSETSASLQTVAVDLANARSAIKSAAERHLATKALAENAISSVEQVDKEEVSLKILSLQTRLEASYQVTATLKNLSLVNFL